MIQTGNESKQNSPEEQASLALMKKFMIVLKKPKKTTDYEICMENRKALQNHGTKEYKLLQSLTWEQFLKK